MTHSNVSADPRQRRPTECGATARGSVRVKATCSHRTPRTPAVTRVPFARPLHDPVAGKTEWTRIKKKNPSTKNENENVRTTDRRHHSDIDESRRYRTYRPIGYRGYSGVTDHRGYPDRYPTRPRSRRLAPRSDLDSAADYATDDVASFYRRPPGGDHRLNRARVCVRVPCAVRA